LYSRIVVRILRSPLWNVLGHLVRPGGGIPRGDLELLWNVFRPDGRLRSTLNPSVGAIKLLDLKMLKAKTPSISHTCTSLQVSRTLNPNLSFPRRSDPAHLHEVHPRKGHHDLLRRADPQPDADAQRRLRPAHRPGVHVRQPAAAHRDGRHGDGPPQRHLSHLRR